MMLRVVVVVVEIADPSNRFVYFVRPPPGVRIRS
jgi:hypothetical protein